MPKYFELRPNTNTFQELRRRPEFPLPYRIETLEGNEYWSARRIHCTAFIGCGTAIAYYLQTLGPAYVTPTRRGFRVQQNRNRGNVRPARWEYGVRKPPGIVFGERDEWTAEVRGGGFINHELHQFAHWGFQVPQYSEQYVERSVWARENARVIAAADVLRVEENVRRIRRLGDIFAVSIGGEEYLALKVVVGAGAGPHQRPDTQVITQAAAARALDLDEFMRRCPRPGRLGERRGNALNLNQDDTVVVNGANAGIDAVERAAECGYAVCWFIGSTAPVILPGNRLQHAPQLAQTATSIWYNIHIDAAPNDGGPPLLITYVPRQINNSAVQAPGANDDVRQHPQCQQMRAHYYVYALGQDPMAQGAVGDVLITQGNLQWADMEPIYDINQVFGDSYKTVLGLRVKGTTHSRGLEVIGAASTSLAAVVHNRQPRIGHNFREQFPPLDNRPDEALTLGARLYRRKLVTGGNAPGKSVSHLSDRDRRVRAGVLQRNLIAAAERFHAQREHTVAKLMERVVENEVASVLQPAQLVGLKQAIAAINGMIPAYITKGGVNQSGATNYNSDNRTMLRVYIAHRYPDMEEERAQWMIDQVLSNRRSQHQPLGFDDTWTQYFEHWMQVWDEFGRNPQ